MSARIIGTRELARRLTLDRAEARAAKLAARECLELFADSLDAWQGSDIGEAFADNRGHPIDSDYE